MSPILCCTRCNMNWHITVLTFYWQTVTSLCHNLLFFSVLFYIVIDPKSGQNSINKKICSVVDSKVEQSLINLFIF